MRRDRHGAGAPRPRLAEAPELPDVRDGLTRKERAVLFVLARLEEELGGRNVPLPMLYGRVLEHVDLGVPELVAIVARLGAKRGVDGAAPR